MYCEREGDLGYMYSLLFIDYLDYPQPRRKASPWSRWAFDTLLIAEISWGGDGRLAQHFWYGRLSDHTLDSSQCFAVKCSMRQGEMIRSAIG